MSAPAIGKRLTSYFQGEVYFAEGAFGAATILDGQNI
jgi:hypothetical protein